jgi:hypothetical protein
MNEKLALKNNAFVLDPYFLEKRPPPESTAVENGFLRLKWLCCARGLKESMLRALRYSTCLMPKAEEMDVGTVLWSCCKIVHSYTFVFQSLLFFTHTCKSFSDAFLGAQYAGKPLGVQGYKKESH